MKKLVVFTDGGSRGNPGPAAIGGVILQENQQVAYEFGTFVGQATNNEAEYQAIIAALNWLEEQKIENTQVEINLDSKLVVEQLNKQWKIKEPRMLPLAQTAWQKMTSLSSCQFTIRHIPRDKNIYADALVNQALDLQAAS